MLNSVITKKYRTYSVDKVASTTYVKGVLQKTFSTESVELTVMPIPLRLLKASPEGMYDIEDLIIHRAGTIDIPDGSILTFQDRKFEIRSFSDRNLYGGFSMFIGKIQKKGT